MPAWDVGSWDIQICKSPCILPSSHHHCRFYMSSMYIPRENHTICFPPSGRLMSWISHSVVEPKYVVGTYQLVNAFCFLFNCYGKNLPIVGHAALWTSLVSFFVILVVVPAKAETHQNAHFVFATFVNNTGWTSNGIGVCPKPCPRWFAPRSLISRSICPLRGKHND